MEIKFLIAKVANVIYLDECIVFFTPGVNIYKNVNRHKFS